MTKRSKYKGHNINEWFQPKTKLVKPDEPQWDVKCEVCGQVPTHPLTGMCGPCTFGEADTIGGNW